MQENGEKIAIFSLEDGVRIAASTKPVTGEKDTRMIFGAMAEYSARGRRKSS